MREIKKYRSVVEILQDAIDKEVDSFDYYYQCAQEVSDRELKDFLLKLAQTEEDHRQQLEEYLREAKAQMEIDEAIMSSFDY
jgi:rubrerythrin